MPHRAGAEERRKRSKSHGQIQFLYIQVGGGMEPGRGGGGGGGGVYRNEQRDNGGTGIIMHMYNYVSIQSVIFH